jgi:hypothetical protein
MKIKMKTTSAGPDGIRMAGQIVDTDLKEAKELIDGGYAEAVEEPEDEEKPKRRK